MTPEKELEVMAFCESVKDCPYDDLVGKNRETILFLCDSTLRLSAIENAGDEEVDELWAGFDVHFPSYAVDRMAKACQIAKAAIIERDELRAKLGEAEKALANPSEIPNSSFDPMDEHTLSQADADALKKMLEDGTAKARFPLTGHGITEVLDAAKG